MARLFRRILQGSEFPPIREDDAEVERLRDIARNIPGALEEVFHLSENPRQCSVAHMAVAQYLRESGFKARITPAMYTGYHHLNEEEFGRQVASRSGLYSKMIGLTPLHQRNPKRVSMKIGRSDEERQFIYQYLYLGTDSFVEVDLPHPGEKKSHYILHAAYRQFLPAERRREAPDIILDRVDAYKLKAKYKLVVTSPEHVANARNIEKAVFATEEPAGLDEEFKGFRECMGGRYRAFKALMGGAIAGRKDPPETEIQPRKDGR
jgi:hypothetical protein